MSRRYRPRNPLVPRRPALSRRPSIYNLPIVAIGLAILWLCILK